MVGAVGLEERRELVAGGQVLDEFAHPAPVGRARARGQRLAIEPHVVVSQNLSRESHSRILSEPPDGRLVLRESVLCAVQRLRGSAKAPDPPLLGPEGLTT